jgi:hypothetical protein
VTTARSIRPPPRRTQSQSAGFWRETLSFCYLRRPPPPLGR